MKDFLLLLSLIEKEKTINLAGASTKSATIACRIISANVTNCYKIIMVMVLGFVLIFLRTWTSE